VNLKEFLKKHNLEEGQLVKVKSKGREFIGNIIPNSNENTLALKLGSGYNVGITIDEKISIEKLEGSKKVSKGKSTKIEKTPALPKITILHTGGTIASRVDYKTGGVIASFTAEDLIAMIPEITKIANIDSQFVSNIMSEDMNLGHYGLMLKGIKKAVESGTDGIIIGHGTDTLGYSAAALSFAVEKSPVPIIIVGAQRSSDRGSSDAGMNLICAAEFITKTDFGGIGVCLHTSSADSSCSILPGPKTRKMHTTRRDAFKAINDTPIATIDYKTKEIKYLQKNYSKKEPELIIKNKFDEKVGILKTYPGINLKQLIFFKKEKYSGLIIEGTGLGHTPIFENDAFVKGIKELIDSGIVVGITSQCIFGRVNPSVYTNLRKVSATGAIYCEDMIAETAYIKLSWLLGNYSTEKAKKMLSENLRGEITKISKYEENFVE